MSLLLLDDHPLYQVGFTYGLRALRPNTEVLSAGELGEALALADARSFHAVLIDMHLDGPEAGGLVGLTTFAQRHPGMARIIVTGDTRPHLPRTCREHGADAFLLKSADAATMWRVIDDALAGRTRWPVDSGRVAGVAVARLTPRQAQVLQHLSRGLSNKAIAATLGLTERAVKMHMTNLLQLSGVANRVELLHVAREVGWLAG
jgi:DNA-binding NarL/FixJ family response regulator